MKEEWNRAEEMDFIVLDLDDDPEIDKNAPDLDIQTEIFPEEEPEEDKQEEKTNPVREILSWALTFVLAIALAMVLKTYVIINANIPTGSMENTIMTGDNVIGFRLAYVSSEPKRGDIIIFYYPDDETQNFVKRVIGLPGDTVTIENGKIYINDAEAPLEEDYLKEAWRVGTGPYQFEVPEDSYFVMGDNRNSSWDSRYWTHTFVSKSKIIGKAWFVYYPFPHFGKLK